jgi:hypothetical protein
MTDTMILEIAKPKGKVAAIGASREFMEALSKTPGIMLQLDRAEGCDIIYEIGELKNLTADRAHQLKNLISPAGQVFVCGGENETQLGIIEAEAILAKAGFLSDFAGYAGMKWDSDIKGLRPVLRCGKYRKE